MNTFQWTDSHGFMVLEITGEQAETASHPGQCDNDVLHLSQSPEIAKQLAALDAETVRKVLTGYGAWNKLDLADHAQNLQRLLWLACGDITDNPELYSV